MKRIDEMYAFVAEDEDSEGITAFVHPHSGMAFPLVAADKERVDSLREIAQNIASMSGKPVKLIKWSVREELETLEPQEVPEHSCCAHCCGDGECAEED
jgi:hypothetical protein